MRAVIKDDLGGDVRSYARRFDSLKRRGVKVHLRGKISSSATMFLGLPNVVIGPKAVFRFHSPYATNFFGRAFVWHFRNMTAHRLPPNLRREYLRSWGRKAEFTQLTAQEIVALEPSIKIRK